MLDAGDTVRPVNTNYFSSRVEGCIPACPLNMLLDEITQRCVYFEDCMFEKLCRLCMMLSLLIYWSLVKFSNIGT